MSKPIIGITGNEREIPDDHFIHMSYTATGFVEGVKEVGGIPMILPIGDEEMAKQYVSIVDKLIITGGQNVCPQFYGEEKVIDSDDYLLKRDIFELALIKEARRQNKPIFTVCRGTQLYNVALGGTLHQDIEDHWQDSSAEYTTQSMVTKNGSILHEIYGSSSAWLLGLQLLSLDQSASALGLQIWLGADSSVDPSFFGTGTYPSQWF